MLLLLVVVVVVVVVAVVWRRRPSSRLARVDAARRSHRSVRLKASERGGSTVRLDDLGSDNESNPSDYRLTIELLLIAGADLNRLNGCGETALAIAEQCGYEVGAEVLRNAKLKELKELQGRKLKTGLGDLPGRKNRAMAFGADMTKEDEVAKATFEAEAAAAKLLASEEEAAVEQTETKSKRQKQKAKQKKRQDMKKSGTSLPLAAISQLGHDAMLEEAAAVVAQFAVVDGLQACSPEVEFVDEDEDGRAAERGDSITAPVAPKHQAAFTSQHTSTTDEEPSARELTLICENSDLRSQLDELRRTHDALIASMENDHSIERDALNQQCAVLAKQNDTLIQKCDDASAEAESERTHARDIEAACDRAFGELKRQASELKRQASETSQQASQISQQVSQIAACSDWRGLTTDTSAGAGAGGAGGGHDAEEAALEKVRKAKARLRRLQGLIDGGEDFDDELGRAHGRLAEVKAEYDSICDTASLPLAD